MKLSQVSESERKEIVLKAKEVVYESQFHFLNEHNGFRPGKIHLFLGVASGGKSTLVRSILVDIIIGSVLGHKTLIWLSEESGVEFCTEFYKSKLNTGKLDDIEIFSELDLESNDPKYTLKRFEEACEKVKPDVIIFDNLTTSNFYDAVPVNAQGMVAKKLKNIAIKYNAPMIIIAHTGADITDGYNRLIESNHIRGGKAIVNLAEFLYILQRIIIGNLIFPTIKITKHRGQEIDTRFFMLDYSKEKMLYAGDRPVPFEEFKEKFKRRNQL